MFVKGYSTETDQQYIYIVRPGFWVSVLYRLTGFGNYEWETAVCTNDSCDIVRGDHRATLDGKTEAEILKWYEEHKHEKNSMDTILDRLINDLSEVRVGASRSSSCPTTEE